ncbi:ATP-binding cassette domain-containing protein [Lysinibacillus sp. NPDC097195]|uniref:ATP-binding cassette domain-containing protein n=1 Tax=Lysinibacillus sp. NPDC097195 TaxID=3364141 RepID=UPI00382F54AF
MLEIQQLSIWIQTANEEKQVLSDASITIPAGKIVGIIGESGSGKSMLCQAIMQQFRDSRRYHGDILFEGRSLLTMEEHELRQLRGNEIALIMQNPLAMFNPAVTIGEQFIATLQAQTSVNKQQALKIVTEQLARFHLPDITILKKYPYELSRGVLQRMMIALAASLRPKLLLVDDPTTALDTMTQLEILEDLALYQQQTNTSMLIVSHDLSVIAKMAEIIIVMRDGQIIEYGPAKCILEQPIHSYSKALLAAMDNQYTLERLIEAWTRTITGELYEYKQGYWVRQEKI